MTANFSALSLRRVGNLCRVLHGFLCESLTYAPRKFFRIVQRSLLLSLFTFLMPASLLAAEKRPVIVTVTLAGNAAYQEQLYPPAELTEPDLKLKNLEDVIAHYTTSSLMTDGIQIEGKVRVVNVGHSGGYEIEFQPKPGYEKAARQYAAVLPRLMDKEHAGQAINGSKSCQETPGCWNPMEGYTVNRRDGKVRWHLFLPLGMPIVNQRSVTLLHYPPFVALQKADYLDNMTLKRWQRLLMSVGIPEDEHWLYDNILDVNPIAAPGSGQSEYPNDYLPIMLSSVYFDSPEKKSDYIRQMLDASLNPEHNAKNKYTLPLLVGGSRLYDPQAPGWFRVRYKAQMPQNRNGTPQMNVLQAGEISIYPHSKKKTPYMGANHMIAAGVTGKCTDNAAKIPDIRQYEAQDLVAACFLKKYKDQPDIAPGDAKAQCCTQWFGNKDCRGAPKPAVTNEKLQICKLAQVDLYFNRVKIEPYCSEKQAEDWCKTATAKTYDPCMKNTAPRSCKGERP